MAGVGVIDERTLELFRVLVSLAFLLYASWSDLKSREVDDRVWLVFAPTALLLTLPQLLQPQSLLMFAISLSVTSALALLLFYAGMFGGADAKALICLAIALPTPTQHLFHPVFHVVSPIYPLTIFCNAVLLAALAVPCMAVKNLAWKRRVGGRLFEGLEDEPLWRKILTFMCGYKVKLDDLKRKGHLYPLESISINNAGGIRRRLVLTLGDEERDEVVGRLVHAFQEGRLSGEVWVTPGLPFLVFITMGLATALLIGDLVWILLLQALG